MMAVFLQAGLGLTPLFAGLILAPHPVGVIVASAYSGRFGSRWFSGRIVASTLMVLCALVAIRFVVLSDRAPETLLLPFLLLGLGVGTGIPALFQMVLSRVGGVDAGAGSGVLQAFQQVGMAFGIAIQGQIFFQMLGADMSEASFRQAAQATLVYPIGVLAALFCLTVARWSRFRFWHD